MKQINNLNPLSGRAVSDTPDFAGAFLAVIFG
jgi:hypothetical protein